MSCSISKFHTSWASFLWHLENLHRCSEGQPYCSSSQTMRVYEFCVQWDCRIYFVFSYKQEKMCLFDVVSYILKITLNKIRKETAIFNENYPFQKSNVSYFYCTRASMNVVKNMFKPFVVFSFHPFFWSLCKIVIVPKPYNLKWSLLWAKQSNKEMGRYF